MRTKLFLAILLTGVVMSAHADSILDGATIQLSWYDPNLSTLYQGPVTAVVGPGETFPQPETFPANPAMAIDVSDTLDEIIFTDPLVNACCYGSSSFNGFDIQVLSSFVGFTGVSLVSSNWPGFDASDLSIGNDGDGILINMEGLDLSTSYSIVISYDTETGPVPEPASLLLLGSGLAALARRLRKSRA